MKQGESPELQHPNERKFDRVTHRCLLCRREMETLGPTGSQFWREHIPMWCEACSRRLASKESPNA